MHIDPVIVKSGYYLFVKVDDCLCLLMPGSQLSMPGFQVNFPPGAPSAERPLTGMGLSHANTAVKPVVQTITRQAMILGAGLSTRFEPVSGQWTGLPKPGVPLLGDQSVIVCLARHLQAHGIQRLIVNTFYHPECIKSQLQNVEGLDCVFVDEAAPSGTAGGLAKALQAGLVNEHQPILVMQGDAVTNADLSHMLRWHAAQPDVIATLGLRTVADEAVSKMAMVTLSPQDTDPAAGGQVLRYVEKPALADAGPGRLGSIGFYVLSPQSYPGFLTCAENTWQQKPVFDYAMNYFPWLLQTGQRLMGCCLPEPFYWNDIGQPMDYLATIADIYAGQLTTDLPQPVAHYFDQGVAYWPGGRLQADLLNMQVMGNAIVMQNSTLRSKLKVT